MKIDRKIDTANNDIGIQSKSQTYNIKVGIEEQLRLLDESEEQPLPLDTWIARLDKLKSLGYALKARLNQLIPSQAFSIGIETELDKYGIPYTMNAGNEVNTVYIQSDILDCIKSGLKQSNTEYILNNATTPEDIEPMLVDLYWQIAEQESMNKFPWINILITLVCRMLLEHVHGFIVSLANAVGGLNGKVMYWCIRPGYLLKGLIIRYLAYPILYTICQLEDSKSQFDTITNKRTLQTRSFNRYIAKMGTIRDEYFYPYWNGGWTNTSGNTAAKTAYGNVNSNLGGSLVKRGNCGSLNYNLNTTPAPISFDDIQKKWKSPTDLRVDTICSCIENPDNISGVNRTDMNVETKIAMDMLAAMLSSHQIPISKSDSIYNHGQQFLDEILSVIAEQESAAKAYSLLSSDLVTGTFSTSILSSMNKLEASLTSFDKMLTSHMNSNYIELAKLLNGTDSGNQSPFVTDVEVDKETLVQLQSKLVTITESIETSTGKIEAYEENIEKYTLAGNALLADAYLDSQKKEKNKLSAFEAELKNINTSIINIESDIADKESTNIDTNDIQNVTDNSSQEVISATIIAAIDMLCCLYSLSLTLGMQLLNGNNMDNFSKNAQTLELLLNPTAAKLESEPLYLGIKTSLSMLDTLLNGIPMVIDAFDTAAATGSYSFKLDADILKIITKVVSKTSFIVVDYEIRKFDQLITDMFDADPNEEITTLKYAIAVHESEIVEIESEINVLLLRDQDEGTEALISAYQNELDILNGLVADANARIVELDSDGNKALTNLLELLSSGQCMGVNYMFSQVIDVLKKMHLQFLLFAQMLDYNPSVEMSFELTQETKDMNLVSFFLDILNLSFKLFPFLTTFCRLDDEVEMYAEIANLYEEMKSQDILEIEEQVIYSPLVANNDTTEPIPMTNGVVDISLYEQNLILNNNGIAGAMSRLNNGEHSILVQAFIECMKEDINNTTTPTYSNIGEEIKRSS